MSSWSIKQKFAICLEYFTSRLEWWSYPKRSSTQKCQRPPLPHTSLAVELLIQPWPLNPWLLHFATSIHIFWLWIIHLTFCMPILIEKVCKEFVLISMMATFAYLLLAFPVYFQAKYKKCKGGSNLGYQLYFPGWKHNQAQKEQLRDLKHCGRKLGNLCKTCKAHCSHHADHVLKSIAALNGINRHCNATGSWVLTS